MEDVHLPWNFELLRRTSQEKMGNTSWLQVLKKHLFPAHPWVTRKIWLLTLRRWQFCWQKWELDGPAHNVWSERPYTRGGCSINWCLGSCSWYSWILLFFSIKMCVCVWGGDLNKPLDSRLLDFMTEYTLPTSRVECNMWPSEAFKMPTTFCSHLASQRTTPGNYP